MFKGPTSYWTSLHIGHSVIDCEVPLTIIYGIELLDKFLLEAPQLVLDPGLQALKLMPDPHGTE